MGSCGHILSRQAINAAASRDPGTDRAYLLLKALGQGNLMAGPVLGQGGRQNGQTGGEVLPAHIYHTEEKRRCGSLLILVPFRLVATPLEPGVVGLGQGQR
jgi:hypothetical protein